MQVSIIVFTHKSSTLNGFSTTNHPAIGVHKFMETPGPWCFRRLKVPKARPGDAEKKVAAEKLLLFRDLINETVREPSSSRRDVFC